MPAERHLPKVQGEPDGASPKASRRHRRFAAAITAAEQLFPRPMSRGFWNFPTVGPFLRHRIRHRMSASNPKERKMVNKDQVEGLAKQAKGAVKDAAGKVTGNKQTQAEGKADKIAGKIQKGYGDAKEKIKKAL
jgi:uncharacterized protein YjbJ (UPF0337 family)